MPPGCPKTKPVRAQTLASLAQFRAFGTILPDTPPPNNGVRGGDILFDVAVNRTNGNLYAVWQDARFSGFQIDQIAFSLSTDGGFTWSAPIKVNLTPSQLPILRQQAFTPSVSVESDGTVVINYYDFRNDTGTAGQELADYWAASCSANCAVAGNWGGEVRLTDGGSFNILNAPLARGYFTGDYEGLAAVGRRSKRGGVLDPAGQRSRQHRVPEVLSAPSRQPPWAAAGLHSMASRSSSVSATTSVALQLCGVDLPGRGVQPVAGDDQQQMHRRKWRRRRKKKKKKKKKILHQLGLRVHEFGDQYHQRAGELRVAAVPPGRGLIG